MGFLDSWNNITSSVNSFSEGLDKNFYSDSESFNYKHKNSSQISTEMDSESPYINYDPFNLYSNSYGLNASNNIPINTNDYIRKWRDASILPEVKSALSEISSEAIVFDEIDDVISLNLDDIELTENIKSKIRESYDKIMYLLDFNEKGEELFKQWYVDGTLTFEVVYNNRKMKDGILKLVLLPPFDIQKYKNVNDGQIRWYINKHQTYNAIKDLEDAEITYFDEQITQITSAEMSPDRRCYFSPLQTAMKAINQLYLLEDSLIIYRLTRSNEKRVFKIDTGNLPKSKAEEYMKQMMNKFRQKKIYNTENGTIDNAAKSISVLEDYWLSINGASGKGSSIDTLQGSSTNFGGFDDINYFIQKVDEALCVPNNRRSKENRVTINATIDIEKDEMKFFKYIQKLRRRFNNLFIDLLKKDLIASQVLSLEDWIKIQEKIKFKYASSNEISMIKKAQINDIKINSANGAMGLLDPQMKILTPLWVQKNILRLTDEEIQEINDFYANSSDGSGIDAMGNEAPVGANPEGGEVPGYSEVGSPVQANMQPTPNDNAPVGGEQAPAPEANATSRFKQKMKEKNLNQDLLNSLVEGDIITDGKQKLQYTNGKFVKVI